MFKINNTGKVGDEHKGDGPNDMVSPRMSENGMQVEDMLENPYGMSSLREDGLDAPRQLIVSNNINA